MDILRRVSRTDEGKLVNEIKKLSGKHGGWYHNIKIRDGLDVHTIGGIRHNLPPAAPVISEYPYYLYANVRKLMPEEIRGKSILEIGPAEGYMTLQLATEGARITAVEQSELFAERLKLFREYFGLTENIQIIHARFPAALAREKFDIILCCGVLYHVDDPISFMNAMVQKGDLIIGEGVFRSDLKATEPMLPRRNHPERRAVNVHWFDKYCRDAGYQLQWFEREEGIPRDKINPEYWGDRKIFKMTGMS